MFEFGTAVVTSLSQRSASQPAAAAAAAVGTAAALTSLMRRTRYCINLTPRTKHPIIPSLTGDAHHRRLSTGSRRRSTDVCHWSTCFDWHRSRPITRHCRDHSNDYIGAYICSCPAGRALCLLSTHADMGKVWIYYLLFVFCFFVCTVTDFSSDNKASGVKFCTLVYRRRGQGISHFGELCSPLRRSKPKKHC